ncbi:MAG: hypothetical protein GXY33_11145 [Phycisphaerae bacterium]|nr:hypothetical protein [Phycisphaerae bacterium]
MVAPSFDKRRRLGLTTKLTKLDWIVWRGHMIAETQRFIDEGLAHPERAVVIPTMPVGTGCFPRSMSDYFWRRVLGDC